MKIYLIRSLVALHFLVLTAVNCQAQPDVVGFRSTVEIFASEVGAGVAVGRAGADVLVLTAYHVVKNSREIHVSFYDKRDEKFPAKVLNKNEEFDVALLTVSGANGISLPVNLPLVTVSDELEIGLDVSLVGHFADTGWLPRFEKITRLTHPRDSWKFLYTSPNLERGISGSPVFNDKGFLLGIVLDRWPSRDGVALKITKVLELLRADWRVNPSLIHQAENPTNSVSPIAIHRPSAVPLTIELRHISAPSKGGRRAGKWRYKVYLDEEQLLFQGVTGYAGGHSDIADKRRVGFKKDVTFSRGGIHSLSVVAVKTVGGKQVEARLRLSSEAATGRELPLTVSVNPERDRSFIFYFVLERLPDSSLPLGKQGIKVDRPFLKDIDRQISDLNTLIDQARRIERESDLDRLRIQFDGWRNRCSVLLGQVDAHQFQLTGQRTNFKVRFDAVAGKTSDEINRLSHGELITRLLTGIEHMDTAITTIKGPPAPATPPDLTPAAR